MKTTNTQYIFNDGSSVLIGNTANSYLGKYAIDIRNLFNSNGVNDVNEQKAFLSSLPTLKEIKSI